MTACRLLSLHSVGEDLLVPFCHSEGHCEPCKQWWQIQMKKKWTWSPTSIYWGWTLPLFPLALMVILGSLLWFWRDLPTLSSCGFWRALWKMLGAAFRDCKTGDLTWSDKKRLKVLQAANPRFIANAEDFASSVQKPRCSSKSIIDLCAFTDTSTFIQARRPYSWVHIFLLSSLYSDCLQMYLFIKWATLSPSRNKPGTFFPTGSQE